MTSPYYFKSGWDREKLAEYILSRFSFIAKPSTVSDDLGTDLFCTLFRLEEKSGVDYPLPLSSFAIQIKSSASPQNFSENIDYLKNLEIPFFWGVVNENLKDLTIYSGENLPKFFPHIGPMEKLTVKPVNREDMLTPYDPMEGRKSNYTVFFPKLMAIGVDSNKEDLANIARELNELCSLIHRNIATVRMQEYIFEEFDRNSYSILAGPGSVKQFRNNFMKRLAENFYNLEWLYNQCNEEQKKEIAEEFRIYEEVFLNIQKCYPLVHGTLIEQYERLKNILSAKNVFYRDRE